MTNQREIAAMIGRMTGNEEVTQLILSGRASAQEVVPLMGGMLDSLMQTTFVPVVGATDYQSPKFPEDVVSGKPLVYTVTLLNGSQIRVTAEAVEE